MPGSSPGTTIFVENLMALPAALGRFVATVDRISRWAGRLACVLIVPMVLSLVYEVFARYLFTAPTIWAYDLTYMLYGTFFMLGAAYTLERQGHIRTDILYANWSVRRQGWTDAVCYLVLFFPGMAALVWVGWEFFAKSWAQGERVVTSPWMPVVYPFKLVIPLSAALLLLQGLSEFVKSVHAGLTGERA
jgi:TRAP-type mannitol/chloroaromatic compound transport system permease small subunit